MFPKKHLLQLFDSIEFSSIGSMNSTIQRDPNTLHPAVCLRTCALSKSLAITSRRSEMTKSSDCWPTHRMY